VTQSTLTQERYFKLSGGGNDFIALAEPAADPQPHDVRALCRRGVSLGADGLFVLRQEQEGVRMHYWNADGLPAELCLNGTRCAALLSDHLEWSDGRVVIFTDAGPIMASSAGTDTITLDVPPPSSRLEEITVELEAESWRGWRVDIGVPHFVIPWRKSLAQAPVATLGAALCHADEFQPRGTNVMFVRYPSPNVLEIRSFERGVEAETQACGTGILAATAVGLSVRMLTLPAEAITLGGFPFLVTGKTEDGRLFSWSLTGDARLLATGEIERAATVEPETPVWSA